MKYTSLVVFLLLLSALPKALLATDSALQNGTYVIPTTDNPASTDPVIVANQDYFSVYVDGVCINRDEGFWTKNVINVSATLEVNGTSITVPVYAGQATKTNCRIAVSNFGILNSIPSRGTQVKLGASILRFDNKDTIKRALTGINSATSDALLKTYAVSSIPYISLVGTIGNELYKTLGPDPNGNVLLQFKGTTLEPDAPATHPFRLRDMVVLQYFGTDALDQAKLSEKNGDVYYNGQPLRSGAWITFRIEKHSNRLDFYGRGWYTKFTAALQELKTRSPNLETVNKNFSDGTVLLYADADFTPTDQNGILKATKDNIDSAEALLKLGKGSQVANAIDQATVSVQQLDATGTKVTPVNVTGIAESAGLGKHTGIGKMAIEPNALKLALQRIEVAPRP